MGEAGVFRPKPCLSASISSPAAVHVVGPEIHVVRQVCNNHIIHDNNYIMHDNINNLNNMFVVQVVPVVSVVFYNIHDNTNNLNNIVCCTGCPCCSRCLLKYEYTRQHKQLEQHCLLYWLYQLSSKYKTRQHKQPGQLFLLYALFMLSCIKVLLSFIIDRCRQRGKGVRPRADRRTCPP